MAQDSPEMERAKRVIRELSKKTEANGCSEHEAMFAAEKIGQMLQDFDLQLSEVFVREEKCKQVEVYGSDSTAYGAVQGIARLCALVQYTQNGADVCTYVLFGLERDVEIAVYLYEIIMEAADVEWGARVTATGNFQRKAKESFRMGFGTRMFRRLNELAEQREDAHRRAMGQSNCTDLVLVREAIVREEWEKKGVRLVKGSRVRIHDSTAYNDGYRAAAKVNINSPLEDDSMEQLT